MEAGFYESSFVTGYCPETGSFGDGLVVKQRVVESSRGCRRSSGRRYRPTGRPEPQDAQSLRPGEEGGTDTARWIQRGIAQLCPDEVGNKQKTADGQGGESRCEIPAGRGKYCIEEQGGEYQLPEEQRCHGHIVRVAVGAESVDRELVVW